MSIMFLQAVILLVRNLLAVILLVAGAAKFADINVFAITLTGLGIRGRWKSFIRTLAFIIPLLECVIGLAVVSGVWPEIMDIILLTTFTFFSIFVLLAARRVPNLTCRCFGALSETQFNSRSIIQNIVLTLLACIVLGNQILSQQQFDGPLFATIILILGYSIFAAAAAQAAKTIADIKERTQS